MTPMTELELDLATVVARLDQLKREGHVYGEWYLLDRMLDCDLPRLARHLTPEVIEQVQLAIGPDSGLADVCLHERWCDDCGRCSNCGLDLPFDVTGRAHEAVQTPVVPRETVRVHDHDGGADAW